MRPSKFSYYADFVVYPLVIAGLAAAGVTHTSWAERSEWLVAGAAGFLFWTLLEYILHRSVLHRKTYFAPMHAQHHSAPLAYLGTPFWISVFVLAGLFLVPVWLYAGFNVADGLTVGVMLGYWWYGVVHHVIHHRGDKYPGNYFHELRAWHMRHHYSPKSGNFGVTTRLWDHLFGTAISVRDKAIESS